MCFQPIKAPCGVQGVGFVLSFSGQPDSTTELSHFRPRLSYILNHYGHARRRRRASGVSPPRRGPLYVGCSWWCAVNALQLFLDALLRHFREETRGGPPIAVLSHRVRRPLLSLLYRGRPRPCSRRVPARHAVFVFLANNCSDLKCLFVLDSMHTRNWMVEQVAIFPFTVPGRRSNPARTWCFSCTCAIC